MPFFSKENWLLDCRDEGKFSRSVLSSWREVKWSVNEAWSGILQLLTSWFHFLTISIYRYNRRYNALP